MRLQRISLTALMTLLVTVSTSFLQNPIQLRASRAWAQTQAAQKVEADRLLQQGIQQIKPGIYGSSSIITINGRISISTHMEVQPLKTTRLKAGLALQSWQQALAIYRQIGDRPGEGKVLFLLGIAYAELADKAHSIESLQQSLVIAREINDSKLEATAQKLLAKVQTTDIQKVQLQKEADRLQDQGNQQLNTSQFKAALQSFQQAITIYRQIGDREGEGLALGNLGITYKNLGEYAKTIEYLQQALALLQATNRPSEVEPLLGSLGIAYRRLGDYAKAFDYAQQDVALARQTNNPRLVGQSLGGLGLVYGETGNYAKAIEYFQQWLTIARQTNDHLEEATALLDLGNAYGLQGDYAKAIEYLQQALALARKVDDAQGEAEMLGDLGNDYGDQGNYAKAIEYEQQSLAIAQKVGDRYAEGAGLDNIGLNLLRAGNLTAAQKTLVDAIKIWESLRAGLGSNDAYKVSIFEQQERTYRTLQQVLIAQNQTDAALEIAERGRARAFVELLTRRLALNPTQPATITPPTIEQLKQIAHTQNATLVEYSIIYDEFKVQEKRKWNESALYIWVISPSGAVTFCQSDLKPLWQKQNTTLTDLVVSSRESMGVGGRGGGIGVQPDETSQAQSLQQLHKILIQPIADLLPKDADARVIFLPQSSLFLVPFPALQDASGNYLIQQHTILTAPAIQVLDLTHQQQQRLPFSTAKNILVVGNPTMPKVRFQVGAPPEQLPSLPGTQQEAIDIATILHTQALTGNQATKAAIVPLLPQARIIHLATHGLLDDFQGLGVPGAIALAPSGQDDGLLTASNILDMKLNAELVVLSACDTGRGRITGDGIIGLSRSLISAGVPSVIVSLWSIPDAPTASLMTEFYQHLQHNPDKAQALRQAMLLTMKQHPNPRDWAAFTLIGEAR